jgi:metabolite-proton symporter
MIGTTVEWYDYFIFGTATALVFNKVFFSNLDPAAGMLAAFATFGVAFVARPIGAVIFGHFGDRLGRKKMLVLSLLLMGIGTVVVGLLPTYEQVGLLAPVLLTACRLFQGLAIGGEWGGAVLMAVEHAPERKRAFYGSWPQIGNPLGMILASVSFLVLNATLSEEAFLSWGWRVPFLASSILIIVGLYVRISVLESPAFLAAASQGKTERVPVLVVFRKYWRSVLVGIGVTAAPNIPYYICAVFIISYATTYAGFDSTTVLFGIAIASGVAAVTIPIAATFTDRIGRTRIVVIGALAVAAMAFPFFWLVDTGLVAALFIALIVSMGVIWGTTYSVQPGFFAELFPASVRYTGTSVSYHFGGLLTSAPIPFLAAALTAQAASSVPLSVLMLVAAAISITAVIAGRKIRFATIDREPTQAPGGAVGTASLVGASDEYRR